ncbi:MULTISPECIES: Na+/H+ antiporter NhaA [unclassified Brevundimonas]|uniref:Na+/H+ antiporter NhaA n=1 Tax=unclassified Brevundimonas TaxID=2622653 RepID=UPI0025BC8CF1|nr:MULTISPECIES: Na+/H+ antiporter NhaA [unclassified Brevundimonas]
MAKKLTLDFLKTEAASGAALGLAALAALIVANSAWSADYFAWLKSVQVLQIGPLRLEETVSDWIKEGLMAVFFLVVGLEIKYEILKGELSNPKKLAMPIISALGGMVAPIGVYLLISNLLGGPHEGWPIPVATDIAFALAVFGLVGKNLPSSLRVFLLTLAIVDDLGAIVLIAALFSQGVELMPLLGAIGVLGVMAVLGRWRLAAAFWCIGFAAMWWLTVMSGLSTSLAAVAFAAIVPVNPRRETGASPLRDAMHDLHPYVAFLVLPVFAFAKAGVSFGGLSLEQAFAPLVIGIALGLFIGKQIGVFGAAWLAATLRIADKPTGASWAQVYGVSLLCGIGFTMSLFIGVLAVPGAVDSVQQIEVKLGVLGGSVLSALVASVVLGVTGRKRGKTMPAGVE